MAKKSTNAEIEERVNTVYKLLLQSHSRFEIVQYAAKSGMCSRVRLMNTWHAQDSSSLKTQRLSGLNGLAAAIARLVQYEKRAGRDDNLQTAIKALETQAKLLRFDI